MYIRYGFDIALNLSQPTTILTMMDVHSDCRDAIVEETDLELTPATPAAKIVDLHGNLVRRLSADGGQAALRLEGVYKTDGLVDEVDFSANAAAMSDLPPDALPYLLPSRYCETDLLSDFAWNKFGSMTGGWSKVQAICDFVHDRLTFSYANARQTRTAGEALAEGVGVCRDFTHLAVALCRASTFRRAIATATSATLAFGRIRPRWISTPGSRPISAGAGSPLTRGTISRASDAF